MRPRKSRSKARINADGHVTDNNRVKESEGDTVKNEHVRMINEAIGKEAFTRLNALPIKIFWEFEKMMKGGMRLHHDGFLGFTVSDNGYRDGVWSNEGFEA